MASMQVYTQNTFNVATVQGKPLMTIHWSLKTRLKDIQKCTTPTRCLKPQMAQVLQYVSTCGDKYVVTTCQGRKT